MRDMIDTFKWKWKTDKMEFIGGVGLFIVLGLFTWLALYFLSLE